jgi:DNA-binding NarL/FixJ family response regulator
MPLWGDIPRLRRDRSAKRWRIRLPGRSRRAFSCRGKPDLSLSPRCQDGDRGLPSPVRPNECFIGLYHPDPREREVLKLLSEGKTTKQIANILGFSGKTIETHTRKVMKKLSIHSIAELTKYAIREGLTSLEP